MINLVIKKSKDVEGNFVEFGVVVDAGTTVTGVDLGLVHYHDAEDALLTLIEDAQEALEKVRNLT